MGKKKKDTIEPGSMRYRKMNMFWHFLENWIRIMVMMRYIFIFTI